MDPIQSTLFQAYAPMARAHEAAVASQDMAQAKDDRMKVAARDDGLGSGLGAEATQARQAAGQETTASTRAESETMDDQRRSRGQILNFVV